MVSNVLASPLRLLIIILATLFVFSFFYGILPLPLALVELEEVKPILFIYPDDIPTKIIIERIDSKANYKLYVFWAYWENHRKQDWEPFAIVYGPNGALYALITRVHWQWRVTFKETIIHEDNRVIIYFLKETHTPLNTLEVPWDVVEWRDYSIERAKGPEEIDWWSIAGLSDEISQAFENAITYSSLTFVILTVILYRTEIKNIIGKSL